MNLAAIRAMVRAARRIPIIGNGDIITPLDAQRMFNETGCAAIAIGRGAFYNPWIFRDTLRYLETGQRPTEPTFEDRIAFMTRHLDLMIQLSGEPVACREFRKVALAYLRPLGPVGEFRRRIVTLRSRSEFSEILAAYRSWRNALLPSSTDGANPR